MSEQYNSLNARYNTKAVLGFVLGLAGFIFGIHLLGIPAVLAGRTARRELATSGEQGEGLAKAAVIIGWIDIALAILVVISAIIIGILAVTLAASGDQTANCITNSTQLGCR